MVQEVEENDFLRAISRNHGSYGARRDWDSVQSDAYWTGQLSVRVDSDSLDIILVGDLETPAVGFVGHSCDISVA